MKNISRCLIGALSISTALAHDFDSSIHLKSLASYSTDAGGESGAEIVAYDARSHRTFTINASDNTLDVFDLTDPAAPAHVTDLSFADYGAGVNSVAVHDGLVAVAVEANVKTDPGKVVFMTARTLRIVGVADVGALPDMVTFTPDGDYLLVANEGEPNSYGRADSVDPEGSISVIDLRHGPRRAGVETADFSAYIGREIELRNAGIRIYGPNANAAQDFEPEYITVVGPRAYVTLQENNAIAVVNIGQARVERILPLGYKSHAATGNGLDPSDRDTLNQVANWPVFGMYQPDGIASFRVGPLAFLVTANEGDARDWPGLAEEARVSSLALDAAAFPNATTLKANANLGRLTVTNQLGDLDGDSDFDRLYSLGGRSISIRTLKGELVWDSGDQLEQITAAAYPAVFNTNHTGTPARDDRSDNKGPEPEGVAIGRIGFRQYAFVGLERMGGVVVYDVTNPFDPEFVQYANTRAFGTDALPGQDDSGPEGITFIPADDSPNGRPLLLVGNEVSKTVTIFEIERVRGR